MSFYKTVERNLSNRRTEYEEQGDDDEKEREMKKNSHIVVIPSVMVLKVCLLKVCLIDEKVKKLVCPWDEFRTKERRNFFLSRTHYCFAHWAA